VGFCGLDTSVPGLGSGFAAVVARGLASAVCTPDMGADIRAMKFRFTAAEWARFQLNHFSSFGASPFKFIVPLSTSKLIEGASLVN
jgi:hypothetical protein